jgi:hypothetical protein
MNFDVDVGRSPSSYNGVPNCRLAITDEEAEEGVSYAS